jgi:hypothetical protein
MLAGESDRAFAERSGIENHQNIGNWLKGKRISLESIAIMHKTLPLPDSLANELATLSLAMRVKGRKEVDDIIDVTTKGWDNFARRLYALKDEKESQKRFLKRCEVLHEEWQEWVETGDIGVKRLRVLLCQLNIQDIVWIEWLRDGDTPPPNYSGLLAHSSGGSTEIN